jgi:hypothetical protein
MTVDEIHVGALIIGPLFPEPVEVLAVIPLGDSIKLIGKGCKTGLVRDPVLTQAQLAQLRHTPLRGSFDGNPTLCRLGIEAQRLALAYEYDPYFSLSIARVDPLPHQLEAVYDYFLKLPRIRFLLADDPGAGKTIMAGLLLKELKARGLVRRTLIVAPANLTFQWQRELKDKFRESFEVIRGETLRTTYGHNPWQDRDQVITSISWVSRVEDAKESLLRSHWDLIVVDEAHKMSAYADDRKTLAYRSHDQIAVVHRAQGHAGLPRGGWEGRQAPWQAPRVGAVGHADSRRDEDRRPRHSGHPHLRRARVQGASAGHGGDRGGR